MKDDIYPNSIITYKKPGSSEGLKLVSGYDAANVEGALDGTVFDPNVVVLVTPLPSLEPVFTTSDGYTVHGFPTGEEGQWRFVYASKGRLLIMPCDIVGKYLAAYATITLRAYDLSDPLWSLEVTLAAVMGSCTRTRYKGKHPSVITANHFKTVVDRNSEAKAFIDLLRKETGNQASTDIDQLASSLRKSKTAV